MTTAIPRQAIPEPIVRKLAALIWRGRMVVLLRGAMATVAAAVVAVLAIMAIDFWVVIFSETVRWALSMTGLAATAAVGLWFIARPLARSFTLTGVARLIESRHPELHERISSTVELLTSPDGPELRGSDELIAALAAEAVADARTVRTSREIRFRAAVPYLLAAAVVLAVLGGTIAAWPEQARRLFRRALLANVSRVSSTALRITQVSAGRMAPWGRDGVDYVLLAGERLHVELEVADDAVRRAELRRSRPGRDEETPLAMARLPDGPGGVRRFAVTCAPAREDFRFRLHAGDALTRYYTVRVVPAPALARIDLAVAHPPYTRRGLQRRGGTDGTIAALPGTKVAVTARTNKPVASAAFALGGKPLDVAVRPAPEGGSECTFEVQLARGMKTRWTVRLKDRYGFDGAAEFPVRAVPDRAPRVEVSVPKTARMKLRPDDRVPIHYRIRDDFGLSAADLRIEIDGTAQPPRPLGGPAGEKPLRSLDGRTTLDLAALPVRGARQVTFRVRAADIVPPDLHGPQEGFSRLFTIELDASAPRFTEQALLSEEMEIRHLLQDVLKELMEAKKDSAPLRHIAPRVEQLTPAVAARVERLRGRLDKADGMLREAAVAAAESVYAGFAEKISALADEHVGKARDLAGQIRITEDRKQRGTLADETDFQVDRSIASVRDLLKQLGVLTDQLARATALDDLAARQDELAEALENLLRQDANAAPARPGDLPPADPAEMKQWQNTQEQLADELAEMVRKTPGAVSSRLREDTAEARDLLGETRRLAQQQRRLARQTRQAAALEPIGRALQQLAARQEQLARRAADLHAPQAPAEQMSRAAEDIRAARLEGAVARQGRAEQQLAETAQQAARAEQARPLAERAARIAREQQALADQAAAAEKARRDAGDNAPAAEQARRRTAGLARRQQTLATQAAQLARQASQAAPPTRDAAGQDPSAAMRQAAAEMAAAKPAEAAEKARRAAEKAARFARTLDQAAESAPPAARKEAPQLAELARQQQQLRQETERLLAARKKQQDAILSGEMARLQHEQAQLASEAGRLADQVKKDAPQADRLETQAARRAAGAAEQLARRDPAGAAESAEHAAEGLQQLARRLQGGDAGRQPAPQGQADAPQGDARQGASQKPPAGGRQDDAPPQGDRPGESVAAKGSTAQEPDAVGDRSAPDAARAAELGQAAEGLAARQGRLARQIRALAQADPAGVLAEQQEALAEQTGEMAQQVGRIREHAEELIPTEPARADAAEAARRLEAARAAQGRAAETLHADRAAQAATPQEQSARALDAAAAALESLGRRLAAAAGKNRPDQPAPDSEDLADAYDTAEKAAEKARASDAQLAARQLSQLAQAAMARARAMGLNIGEMSPAELARMLSRPSPSRDSRRGTGMQMTDLTAAKLRQLGIELTDWARLPGRLRDQVLQAAGSDAPEEYRVLIRRYFREVARRGGREARP